jgi:hypothetical protein
MAHDKERGTMATEINRMSRDCVQVFLVTALLSLTWSGLACALEQPSSAPAPVFRQEDAGGRYFKIQVVDRQTGRGVPLVELRTTNNIRYFTDSNGIVAFNEPGLMDREVFFFVESHGYEFPKDGFGFRGTRLKTSPDGSAVVKIDRLNIAERLYRVTGQGIYSDSVLTGQPVTLKSPVLNGQVIGQDSVDTCIHNGRLFWFWGDTGRPSYPLGHFAMAGAVSDLPERGGLDPGVGVNLEYFVDENGFSRPLCPLKEGGLIWLDGFLTITDNAGQERIVAKYARLKDLGTTLEIGLVAFNEATQSFEPLLRSDPNSHRLPSPDFGHAFAVTVEGRQYYYFALPFPLTVRMRVEATWDSVIDPNRYELLTAIRRGEGILPLRVAGVPPAIRRRDAFGTTRPGWPRHAGRKAETASPRRVSRPSPLEWVRFGELVGGDSVLRAQITESLKKERQDTLFYDAQSGRKVTPHGGSVYYNSYRGKWIAIFVEAGGESSYLGEVWYAEADTPVGPWAYARKVVTHNKYSFYNPKHHPYFDKDGGRKIFFEGTYSQTFSGPPENATPRYDYNQIMYRLNLDDPRLVLPAPIYQVGWANSVLPTRTYLLADGVETAGKWGSVESVPFYAVEPKRAGSDLVPVYTQKTAAGNGQVLRLTTTRPDSSAEPLFYAMPPDSPNENPCIVPLYEYRHTDTAQYLYWTEPQLPEKGWVRTQDPLCRVWKSPPGPLLIDSKAKPAGGS